MIGSSVSELRKDLVSGEWVLLARDRAKRPHQFRKRARGKPQSKSTCPFENPQKSGGGEALLWYADPAALAKDEFRNWFLQVIANKFPAVAPHTSKQCPARTTYGPYRRMDGVGYHEVIVTRPHDRSLGEMTVEEGELVMRAYRERYAALAKDPCVEYVLIFHNHGREAGASISHPHSQLIALPILPPDIKRSFRGSQRFFKKFHTCIYCKMLDAERRFRERVVHENKEFITLAPYASHVPFELRIYPQEHDSRFELLSEERLRFLTESLIEMLKRLHRVLGDPAYNFFIHTTPANMPDVEHYHWHLEILPKISVPAGLELGTGIDVSVVPPEEVPKLLRV